MTKSVTSKKSKISPRGLETEIIDLNKVIYEVRERQYQILNSYEEIYKVFDKLKSMEDDIRSLRSVGCEWQTASSVKRMDVIT